MADNARAAATAVPSREERLAKRCESYADIDKKERTHMCEAALKRDLVAESGVSKKNLVPKRRPKNAPKKMPTILTGHISNAFHVREVDLYNQSCSVIGCNKTSIDGAGFARRTPRRARENQGRGSLDVVRGWCGDDFCLEIAKTYCRGWWWSFTNLETGILDTTRLPVDEYNSRDDRYAEPKHHDVLNAYAVRRYLQAKAWDKAQAKED